jgi:hypothetical protein
MLDLRVKTLRESSGAGDVASKPIVHVPGSTPEAPPEG